MDKLFPKKLGDVSKEDIVYYLEEKFGAALGEITGLPELPEDDGTYTLQLELADGEATFTWEAVE